MHNSQFAAMLGSGHSDWGRVISRAERGLRGRGIPPEREGLLRHNLALALWETGDLYRSEQEFQRVIALGEGSADLASLQADALYRLGNIHRLLRRPEQEVEAFRQAACRHARLRQTARAVRCQVEAGRALLLAGRAKEALPELEAAAAGLIMLDAPDLVVELRIVQALYASLTGDREGSDRHCLELLNQPPLAPCQRAEIAWILGCNAFEAGDRTAAELHAAIAQEYAVEAWWPPQMERINHLRRRLAAGDGESRRSSPPG
ncbi:MAG: hypothetical protein ACOY94_09895 [Bacillota bacterium]